MGIPKVMLANIQAKCKEFQIIDPKPFIVKLALPRDDIMFESEVIVEIMYIERKPLVHVMD